MKRFKILWIDDEWNTESSTFSFLSDMQNNIDSSIPDDWHITWELKNVATDGIVEISERYYDLAIVDLNFYEQGYGGTSIIKFLIRNGTKFIIYSAFTKGYQDKQSHKAVKIIDKYLSNADELVQAVINFLSAPPVKLLHLTDLHFYSDGTNAEVDESENLYSSLITCIGQENEKIPFDSIMITGDFSGTSPSSDLTLAQDFLNEVLRCSISRDCIDKVFIIPGNHDVEWIDFSKKIISPYPYKGYLNFFQSFFFDKFNILSSMPAWNDSSYRFNYDSSSNDLYWNRKSKFEILNVIGMATPSLDPDKQGLGDVNSKSIKLIDNYWSDTPKYGEIRIALMHHNVIEALSKSPFDEKSSIFGKGDLLSSLLNNYCNLVLSGHTHSTYIYNINGSISNLDGFKNLGHLTILNSGPTGGRHPSGDRPRSFNIIEISELNAHLRRSICVRNFIYDSLEIKWKEKKSFDDYL